MRAVRLIILSAFAGLAAPAPGANAPPQLTEALAEATTMCSGYGSAGPVKLKLSWEQFMDLPPAFAAKSHAKTFGAMSPLARQFMATAPSVRTGGRPFAVFHLSTSSGEVWTFPGKNNLCDAIVSGSKDVPTVASTFVEALGFAGWELVKRTDGSNGTQLEQRILLKRSPLPNDADFGTRARFQWSTAPTTSTEGVQLEINFTSGTVRLPKSAQTPSPK